MKKTAKRKKSQSPTNGSTSNGRNSPTNGFASNGANHKGVDLNSIISCCSTMHMVVFGILVLILSITGCIAAQGKATQKIQTPTGKKWGGTEYMMENLHARLPDVLKERFNIMGIHDEVSTKKKNILWLHDLPSEPMAIKHLQDPSSRAKFTKIIFISNHQQKRFEEHFQTKFDNGLVLRNAIEPFDMRSDYTLGGINDDETNPTVRLIYHSTPHRGLDILLAVFFQLWKEYNAAGGPRLVLDVYSSFKIYDRSDLDMGFNQLFDQCREHPACNYHGSVPNDQIREALEQSHIFAFPSTFEETSCIAAIEALSAGLEIVTSSLGALPETLNGFATMYPFVQDKQQHATYFYQALKEAIEKYDSPTQVKKRRSQQIFASEHYNLGEWGFGGRIKDWVLGLALTDGPDSIFQSDDNELTKFKTKQDEVDTLTIQGGLALFKNDFARAVSLFKHALTLDPNFSPALIALGHIMMMMTDSMADFSFSDEGVKLLEHALTSDEVHPKIEKNQHVYYEMTTRMAIYYSMQYRNKEMQLWLDRASDSKHPHNDCWQIFRASDVKHLPLSKEEAELNLARFHQFTDELMNKEIVCDNNKVISTSFPLAYYDDINYGEEISKHHSLIVHSFPWLEYKSNDLVYQDHPIKPTFASEKIRVGVVSSYFTSDSSIWGNFGATMRNLQSHPKLDVSFIYYPNGNPMQHANLSVNPESNIYLESSNDNRNPLSFDSPAWLSNNRNKIEEKNFDVLLYLDMFMNFDMNMIATSKLAPVQICTHGHPVTSGVPRKIMDYYLSWDLAELPDKDKAQSFYTEELYRIDAGNKPWEYYEPRTQDGVSKITKMPFSQYTRENISFITIRQDQEMLKAPNAKWYFCSQAVFKYSMVFDRILGDIQKADRNAVIILIELTDKQLKGKLNHEYNSGLSLLFMF